MGKLVSLMTQEERDRKKATNIRYSREVIGSAPKRWKMPPEEAEKISVPEGYKLCRQCATVKNLVEDFSTCSSYKDGRQTYCKPCRAENAAVYRASENGKATIKAYQPSPVGKAKSRNVKLKKAFGITQDQWDAMFESQGKLCACCGKDTPRHPKGWHTDHDHRTGEVCAILCHMCNCGVGHFNDDPDAVFAAYEYLLRTRPPLEAIIAVEKSSGIVQ